MPWYDEPTIEQKYVMRQAADKIYQRFGSYNKIMLALQILTGEYIGRGVVNNYLNNVETTPIPIHWAASLSDLVDDVQLADFYPWLTVYFERHYD